MKKKADLADRVERKIYMLVVTMLDTSIASLIRSKSKDKKTILQLIGIKQALNLDFETF